MGEIRDNTVGSDGIGRGVPGVYDQWEEGDLRPIGAGQQATRLRIDFWLGLRSRSENAREILYFLFSLADTINF